MLSTLRVAVFVSEIFGRPRSAVLISGSSPTFFGTRASGDSPLERENLDRKATIQAGTSSADLDKDNLTPVDASGWSCCLTRESWLSLKAFTGEEEIEGVPTAVSRYGFILKPGDSLAYDNFTRCVFEATQIQYPDPSRSIWSIMHKHPTPYVLIDVGKVPSCPTSS
ncbi:hypothetical protein FOZ61_006531 [Perkinsus olseni]|uniref:Uncharacterized protein n=1 Tax=Perkinsus olseni TaxID=32597 RepID=A0A7J6LCS8_PEROL|nr:hypothetical protein FOZ61_006531 [Perkinsus olseni]